MQENKLKIIVVGASGTVGKAVVKRLAKRHDIVTASRDGSDVQVDITEPESITAMYQKIGRFDALISATGKVHFGKLAEITGKEWDIGLHNKLMGQVNLVTLGLPHIRDNGSFTLTSGILNRDPIVLGSSAAMVNGAIDGFVTGGAIEMPRGVRINVVSPTVIVEALGAYEPFFRGFNAVPADKVAMAFEKSVEGAQTGQVYRVDS